MANDTISREAVIADAAALRQKYGKVTRSLYRAHGAYSEKQWSQFFPSFKDLAAAAATLEPQESSTVEECGDTQTISIPQTTIHTLEQLIEAFKIDLNMWKVDRFIANKWDAPNSDPLYQVKAFLSRRVAVQEAAKEIAELKELAKKDLPAPAIITLAASPEAENMLEIVLADHHFGKLAWADETGHEHYDTRIAFELYTKALNKLLNRTAKEPISKILYVIGNDILHSDDREGRTTKGTFVDCDGRYHKTFGIVRNTVISAIKTLRNIAPVHVLVMPGNHDQLSAWHLGDSIECYFHTYPDIKVDNRPLPRKYVHYGVNLLGFTHGDKGKHADYPLLMAVEYPEAFANSKYREWHVGHWHQTRLNEKNGVRVRVLPALSPPDEWHSSMGFIGNWRTAEAYVWNFNEGLVGTAYYNVKD